MRTLTFVAILALAGTASGIARTQEPPRPAPPAAPAAPAPPPAPVPPPVPADYFELVPLRVQVVVSRYQGEKRISSVPYALSVNANSLRQTGGAPSRLRMGAQVPVPTFTPLTVDGKPMPGGATAGGPITYRDIGTNIDCTAYTTTDGRFRVILSIEDTSVYANAQAIEGLAQQPTAPVFRSFRSNNELVLRDGQSAQFTAATDRVNGETTRVEVTLTVVK